MKWSLKKEIEFYYLVTILCFWVDFSCLIALANISKIMMKVVEVVGILI